MKLQPYIICTASKGRTLTEQALDMEDTQLWFPPHPCIIPAASLAPTLLKERSLQILCEIMFYVLIFQMPRNPSIFTEQKLCILSPPIGLCKFPGRCVPAVSGNTATNSWEEGSSLTQLSKPTTAFWQ